MADKKLFSTDTPFSEVIIYLQKLNYCSPASVFFTKLLQDNPGITFGEAIAQTKESWAIWCLKVIRPKLDSSAISGFLSRVQDPPRAFRLYIELEDLSEDQYSGLKSKFQGHVPRAEGKLKSGLIKPNRGVSNG